MKTLLRLALVLFTTATFAQAGHIMQGVGAVNMSMGGASTAQPLDISGALQWNPAAISVFDDKILNFDIGLFFSSPELFSTVPEFNNMGQPTGNFFSGNTEDDRGVAPMPAVAMVWGKADSKHTFGASAFGVSGFGVTFPQNMSNPINMPQPNGFGHIESDYMLLQIGFTWAYEVSDNFSIGVEPTINYGALEMAPNPTANPNASGWPVSDNDAAIGVGAQFGIFYNSDSGIKLGASYKTEQDFGDYEFENTHLDNATAQNSFKMNYPSILSLGFGYSNESIDFALDYRNVGYENTDGFEAKGWSPTASVVGFGWKNIDIISVGFQYKGIEKLPLRIGYTYSSNPIDEELAFFSVPATAIIKNAFQLGFSYPFNDNFMLNGVYHYGTSGGETKGQILNPGFIQNFPPYGAIPGSEVSYDMTTSMIMFGFSYTFKK
jgi:long-chain fatty acid transport protein